MARRKTRPDRVGNALQHVLQRIDPERRLELFRVWSAEVGPAIASRAQPTAFRDGILSVRVSTAAWMQELQFAKEDIRQRLNQRLGAEAVRDVYFVAGGADPRPQPAPVVVRAADDEPEEPIDLPPLRDARLSEVFTRIARAHQRRPRR
jgi:predicted nucleic acid-binding Zn ribbon protein